MIKPLLILALLTPLLSCGTPPPTTKPVAVAVPTLPATDAQIDAAMKRAAEYLLAINQTPPGFETAQRNSTMYGAQTALAAHALISAGEILGDQGRLSTCGAEVAPLIIWLQAHRSHSLAGAAWRCVALGHLHLTAQEQQQLDLDEKWPLVGYAHDLEAGDLPPAESDLPHLAQAMLAAEALCRTKIEIPSNTYKTLQARVLKTQTPSGQWQDAAGNATPLTSTLGTLSLLIAKDELDSSSGPRLEPKPDPDLAKALAAYSAGIRSLAANPMANDLETLFYAQRIADYTGEDFLFTPQLAGKILALQRTDGSFPPASFQINPQAPAYVSTSFALAILAQIRRPVIFQRLDFATPSSPYAVPHLTDWLSRQFEHPYRWRRLSPDAPLKEWRVPITIIDSVDDAKFTQDHIQRLADYIRAGGTIFSASDRVFRQDPANQVAPILGSGFTLRTLPSGHPLFNEWANAAELSRVTRSLGNGVREVWIHALIDMSADWDQKFDAKRITWRFAANLCLYVNHRTSQLNVPAGLSTPPGPTVATAPAKSITVARIPFRGKWDPEPGAWSAFACYAADRGLTITTRRVAIADLDPAQTPVAHITSAGTGGLADQQAESLLAYVQSGGLLIVDAAGGTRDARDSILPTITAVINIPNASALPIQDRDLRPFSRTKGVPVARRIYDLRIGQGRLILAPGDLTAGLLGLSTSTIDGVTTEKAREIVLNALLDVAGK